MVAGSSETTAQAAARRGRGRREQGLEEQRWEGKEEGEHKPGRNSQPSVRRAPRYAPLTPGAPKWALGAGKVSQGRAGADLARRLPSSRQEAPGAATRTERPRAASANSPFPPSQEAFHAPRPRLPGLEGQLF